MVTNDKGFHPEAGGILCIKDLQLLFGRKINAIVYCGKYILLSCARQCVRDACGRGSQKISPMLSGIGELYYGGIKNQLLVEFLNDLFDYFFLRWSQIGPFIKHFFLL